MPVGIENLATGFLQGLNARKQQDRQDVIDQREAERFDMQKAQFADNQAANQLSMKTNQFQLGQAQTEADRKKILQEEADNFHKKMKGYFSKQSSGDYTGFYGDLEKDRIASGINGQFLRDEKGNIAVGADGSAIWTDGTLKGRVAHTPDSALEEYYNAFNPEKAIESRISARAELAKSNREFKQKKELVGLQAANSLAIARENNASQDKRLDKQLSTQERVANIRAGAKSEASYEPLLPLAQQFFGSRLTSKQLKSTTDQISKDEFIANGLQNFKLNNVGKFISTKDMQQAEQSLNQLADSIYGKQTVSANNQPIQTREGLITPKNLDGGGIDMSDFQLTTGGGGNMQNANPSVPVPQTMPVPQVSPTASYKVPTNKGYVLYDENGNAVNYVTPTPTMPIDIVNAVRDAIPDLPPPRRLPAGQNFFSGSNPFEKK